MRPQCVGDCVLLASPRGASGVRLCEKLCWRWAQHVSQTRSGESGAREGLLRWSVLSMLHKRDHCRWLLGE